MKSDIHPRYDEVTVVCACGATFAAVATPSLRASRNWLIPADVSINSRKDTVCKEKEESGFKVLLILKPFFPLLCIPENAARPQNNKIPQGKTANRAQKNFKKISREFCSNG